MANLIQRIYGSSDTILIPSNVKSVIVTPVYENQSLMISDSTLNYITPNNLWYGSGGIAGTGYLGDGTTTPKSSPILCQTGSTRLITKIKTTGGGRFALNTFLNLLGWGPNNLGQVGNGTVGGVDISVPVVLHSANSLFINFDTGLTNSVALDSSGNLYSWPIARVAFGSGTVSSPTIVPSTVKFTRIIRGGTETFIQDISGNTYAIGDNTFAQLGIGTLVNTSTPTLIAGGHKFYKIRNLFSAGYYGFTNSGQIYGWGTNLLVASPTSTPVLIAGGLKFKDIMTADPRSAPKNFLAIDFNNNVWGWGSNAFGELGIGNTNAVSSPTIVFNGIKASKVFCSSENCFVLDLNGNLYGAGNASNGRLGDGSITSKSTPTLIGSPIKFSTMTPGFSTNFAIGKNNVLYGWGQNSTGILGNGTITNQSSPVAVLGEIGAKSVASVSTVNQLGTQVIEVIPNTTYTITIADTGCYFGNVVISDGIVEKILVSYYQ